MLYLFLNAETEVAQLQLCQTLANPEGSLYRYFYSFSGAPNQLRRHTAALHSLSGAAHQPCLLIAFDRSTHTFLPLRLGSLVGIGGCRNGEELPMDKTMAMCKKGRLSLVVKIRLGNRIAAADPSGYGPFLKSKLARPLPDEDESHVLLYHHISALPDPPFGDLFPLLAKTLAALPGMMHSNHRVLLQCDTVTIPTAHHRLLRVRGHNFDSAIRSVAAVTNHTITHIQSVLPDSDFTFFASLPAVPNGSQSAVIELDTRKPLCLAE